MTYDDKISQRIQERAYRLWEEEGCPEGRADSHWEQARAIIALEDNHAATLLPVEAESPEPIEALSNQGSFPTTTDQDEQQIPARS
jgi:hypothetical protein